ncbi:PAS domain S-box-containing protein [Aquabacterium commune]|uniref:histidine kinase n=1 Tax=Aquabacterium commune TaxID=70586 RepID=A0A4R6RNS6_9BURK|nr:PAS domain S-box protein [Aquabacterium commune]TDP88401.1 PAS domain S-box-containing protein [Aquabacterium commune]
MPDAAAHDELPDSVLRVLQRLERITGRMPVARTVALIIAVGLLVTALTTAAVWWAERQRVLREFEAAAARFQMLVQDRLDQRSVMVHQVASWAKEQAQAASVRTGTWSFEGVTVWPRPALQAGPLAERLGVDEPLARAIAQCMGRWPAQQSAWLCPMSLPGQALRAWLLAERVQAPGSGWVTVPLRAEALLAMPPDEAVVSLKGELLDAVPTQAASALQSMHPLRVAGRQLTLRVTGEQLGGTWQDLVSRRAGMWIAAGAGMLFTLAALHVYLMLISTRRRAREMSRDMGAALQRTQSRNQAVMDTAPDAILMVDAFGKVQWCNQAVASIFGRTSEDLLDQHLQVVLPSLGQDTLDAWFATYGFSNRVIGHETTGRRNEDVLFPVAVSASRTEVDGAFIQTFIVRDTTDAKWAEQELTLRDRALASSADGVVIVSMTLPNQPMIYVNRAFEAITGYEAHELLGLNCRIFQQDDTQQPGIGLMREAIREGRSCQVVLRNYRKSGDLFYNDLAISPVLGAEGVLTHYVGVATDITDRIAAEKVLLLRTERLNAVFDLSPDGFVVLDKRGEVSIVNPSFERMTGLLAADLVGHSLSAFEEQLMARCQASEVDAQTVAGLMAGVGDAEVGPSATRELLHMHTPSIRTLVRRVRHGGHDNETVMYFRDITHELEVDRMKSEFLAMAAHELRTPMVSIFGFTELLLQRPFNEERRKDMLSTIHRQASVLINLVNELLDLARIESRRGKDFQRERLQLQSLIDSTVQGLLVHNDPRKVECTLPAVPVWVDVDRQKLSLALTNVLSNAYKYSPQGGDIALDLVWRDRNERPECGIRITDQGLGMTPAQREKVFDRFFRADTSGNIPGTGLGMTIVKEILELHGGQASVTSELGVGTTVILWVPAVGVPAEPAAAAGLASLA